MSGDVVSFEVGDRVKRTANDGGRLAYPREYEIVHIKGDFAWISPYLEGFENIYICDVLAPLSRLVKCEGVTTGG